MKNMEMILHTDGGARGNPGPGAAGAVLMDKKGKVIREDKMYLGKCTNNEAEYKALIIGLELAKSEGATRLKCFLDSELLVKQLNRQYKVKRPNMKALYGKVSDLSESFRDVTFAHVTREKNARADSLVNEVLDAKI